MTGPLENSVTLDEILAVVAAKRVPLAAELAGYLALEMAEGAGSIQGALDAQNVYVSDEGTVALVRARKEGDAETSVRGLLARLLEAGGTQTPALGAAARKGASGGAAILARELEAALIPVNRAAGRRALARLAREIKRVTLGVGRNASLPASERGSRSSISDGRRASGPGFSEEEIPTTAKRGADAEVVAEARRSEFPEEAPTTAAPSRNPSPLQRPESSELPTMELSGVDAARLRKLPEALRDSANAVPSAPPAGGEESLSGRPPETEDLEPVGDEPKDDVDALLSSFAVTGEKEEKGIARDLKALVGVDPTPAPPAGYRHSESEREADDDDVEALLSLSSRGSVAPEPPREPTPAPERAPARRAASPSDRGADAGGPARERASAPPRRESKAPPASASAPPPSRPTSNAPRPPSRSYADERSMPTTPSQRKKPPASRKIGGTDVLLGLVLAALLGVGGYLLAMRMLHPAPPEAPTPSVSSSASAAASSSRALCKAALTIDNAPEKSEILLRVGQAPVEIDHMPVGTRLEFVATADGHSPKRAVVPAGAAWEKNEATGKPRYELAVQLDPSPARARGKDDAWPPAEPGSSAGGEGPPGVVRVVSSPKGAEVWLLVGLGPEAVIDRLPCTGDTQVLVAGPGTPRKRLVVHETDFADVANAPGQKAARLSVK